MKYIINGITKQFVTEIDYIMDDIDNNNAWRESKMVEYPDTDNDLVIIELNDAWISVENEHVYICYDDVKILLPRVMFGAILIS